MPLVSVSELMVTASQRHVLPLQARPYQEDQLTGLLTIAFLFKDVRLSWEDKYLLPGVYRYISPTLRIRKCILCILGVLSRWSVVNKKTVYSRQASQVPGKFGHFLYSSCRSFCLIVFPSWLSHPTFITLTPLLTLFWQKETKYWTSLLTSQILARTTANMRALAWLEERAATELLFPGHEI